MGQLFKAAGETKRKNLTQFIEKYIEMGWEFVVFVNDEYVKLFNVQMVLLSIKSH